MPINKHNYQARLRRKKLRDNGYVPTDRQRSRRVQRARLRIMRVQKRAWNLAGCAGLPMDAWKKQLEKAYSLLISRLEG